MTQIGLVCHGGGTTGNERYMVELIRALQRRDDEDLCYTVFYTRESTRAQMGQGRNTRFYRLRPEAPWIRATLALPWAVRRSGVALVHSQYGVSPLSRVPTVVTVHDIFVADRPEMYPLVHRLQLLYRIPRALTSARRVIVPSEFTRREILSRYRVDPDKLHVIPLGVSDRFKRLPGPSLKSIRERLELPESFVLYVGALQPRKNLIRLVNAFRELPDEMRLANPLLIAGSRGWLNDELDNAAQPLLSEGTLRFLGYLSDEEVPAVMNLATVFAFPSLSEGFGFPAVEAMRCGTCVLAGRAGSLPEIVGDGGLLVNPLDSGDICRGLAVLLENASLRGALRERGVARASLYTWERTAHATVNVYQEILKASGRRQEGEVPCLA
jgi:glycosyltransferase involved in cell wall biosynthesis